MATPFIEPKLQISDANGAPLSGGKVYTYEAGTTTPKTTYTDAAAGTPNSNPVILDSAGRAAIWGSGTYRVIVKDSSDVTIYDVDNFSVYVTAVSTSFSDDAFVLQDDGDSTKQAKFECSGLSAGTTRTFTLPNSSTTIVGTAVAQDLSNKSFVDATDATKKMTFSLSGITTATTRTITVPDQSETMAISGKQTIWVPAIAMTPRTTNGAAYGTAEMTTNKNMVKTLDFDTTTQEFAQFEIAMPKSWNLSTVTFKPVWSHASTTTNFGCVWALQAVAISDDDTLDVAFGTEQTSTDTGGTTNDRYIGPESAAITVSGTPASGDVVQFQIKRNPSDGSDTIAIDARLHGVILHYTTNAGNDA